jgi:hypothetical protein
MVNLYLAMDKIRMRYGKYALKRAVGVRTREEKSMALKAVLDTESEPEAGQWFTEKANRSRMYR